MNTKKIFTTTLKSLLVVILFSIFTGCNVIKTDLLLPQLMVLRKALATVGLATESNAGAGNPNSPTPPVTPDTPLVTTVDAPIFSPPAGTYTSTQSVSVSTTTTGAILCYTTDGSTPSCD
ncbi:MAG TPA: chitobiase/beta-hexosaminidase C-terminal domain-containing protein, partial [Leptospiraceae bacterium]|nr:chitobiase/beta-hexosaminidase C-terminal domain-containing protein [Leptospiraceae bacterium]